MYSEVSVSKSVEELIKEIISRNNLKEISSIKYQRGSEVGDGYSSKTISVDISNKNELFQVFLKCALNIKSTEAVPVDDFFKNEIHFYDVVFPAFLKFLKERSFENYFDKIPKCYGTSLKNKIIALENLKGRGYVLRDKTSVMNDADIEFVLKIFAKFHAISFAFKDQEKEKYQKLVEGTTEDFLCNMVETESIAKTMTIGVKNFVNNLDSVEDKHILDKCDGLDEKVLFSLKSPKKFLNQYSILTQGDCWCNNMMFLYDKEEPGKPTDIRLIDWQMLRPTSPVFDIGYFFYTIASEEALNNLQQHLKSYHEELSRRIEELKSDPEIVYPFGVFEKEWKQHALYGYAMASTLLRHMLSSKDEALNLENLDLENAEDLAKMYPKLKKEEEYMKRMKILTRHLIKEGYL